MNSKTSETIIIPNISTISFSGTNKEKVRRKKEKAAKTAIELGGEILRDIEFKDGFFLEVMFKETDVKEKWEKFLK